MGFELDKILMHTRTKQERVKGASAINVPMMSQRTKEGGMGIYKSEFPRILREAKLGITLSFPVIDEEVA